MNLKEDGMGLWSIGMIRWVNTVTDSIEKIIRPKTEELLAVDKGLIVLDIACGNRDFSRRLADLGAEVVHLLFLVPVICFTSENI